jgi:hypothetical protein
MSLLRNARVVVVLLALLVWDFASALWCTFVLGQTAAEQISEVEEGA